MLVTELKKKNQKSISFWLSG